MPMTIEKIKSCLFEYTKIHNFIWFQVVWFTAVLLQDAAIIPLFFLIAFHFVKVEDALLEAKVVFSCALVGILVDSILVLQGFFIFHSVSPIGTIPLWLIALWFGFVGTLRHSLSYLLRFPIIASLLASVSAPLTYILGTKLGAVEFGMEVLNAGLIMGILWFVMMYLFVFICNRITAAN